MMSTTLTKIIPDRSRPGSTTTASSIGYQDGGFEKWTTGKETKTKMKLAKREITIGTWNVRTLYADGKLIELEYEMQRYRWNVLGLAEMRWSNTGEMTTDDGHKLWWSGKEKRT
ncbi:Uncharacterised protein r2_g1901 [Pycnogonum litorale]